MATFLDIQGRVKRRLIDLPATTLSEVPDFVNDALHEAQLDYNFKVMEDNLNANTAAITRNLVAVPANFKEFRLQPYYTEFTGYVVDMEFAKSRRQMQGLYETDSTGPPQYILHGEATDDLGSASLEVWPLSDSQSDYSAAPAGQYRVTIPYYSFLPDLAADGSTNWFTLQRSGVLYLIARAVAQGFAVNWDTDKETEWLALAKAAHDKLVLADKRQRFAGQDTFVIHQGANWQRSRGLYWS